MTEQAWLHLLATQSLLFSAAVMVVALLRLLLARVLDAGALYLAWLLVPLAMLAPVLPSLPGGQVLPEPATLLAQAVPDWVLTTSPQDLTTSPATALARAPSIGRGSVSTLALGVWVTGVATALALLTRRQRRYGARLQRGADAWLAPAGDSPALLGIWRTRLVLPADFTLRFTPSEQSMILAHEAVHARRHDNAWNLLGAALLVLQWFNPLGWWALRRMRQDQELACDAAVLNRQTPDAEVPPLLKTYVNALLKSHPGRNLPVLSTGWAHRHPLLERVRLLAHHVQPAWRRRLGRAGVIGLCLGITALSQATNQPPVLGGALPAQSAPKNSGGLLAKVADVPATAPVGGRAISSASQPSGTVLTVAAELATTPASALQPGQGLVIELDSQQGGQAWQHRRLSMVLPKDPTPNGPRAYTLESRQGDWCLSVMFYAAPGDTLRPMAFLLDKDCRRSLGATAELSAGAGPHTLVARLPDAQDAPLQAQLSLTLADPKSPAFRAELETPRVPMTPQEKADAEHYAEETRKRQEFTQAQDKAWRQARGEKL